MAVFAMFAAMMYAGRFVMQALPNIHPVGMLVMVLTVVYRVYALIPLYLYVLLEGLLSGFSAWWVPYLYIWTVLWGMTMLIPKKIPPKIAAFVYPLVCALFGMCYGTLYAPMQVLLFFHGKWEMMWPWIVAGLPFDATHAAGNLCMGLLVLPLSKAIALLRTKYRY